MPLNRHRLLFIRTTFLSLWLAMGFGSAHNAIAESDAHAFLEQHQSLVGLYQTDDEFVVIGQIPEAEIIYFQRLKTGDMRFLRATDKSQWVYSPTRNATDTIAGHVKFENSHGSIPHLDWTEAGHAPRRANRVSVNRQPFEISTPGGATLAGELITPEHTEKSAVLILVPQSNRYNIFDVGMWALSRGIGVAIYDQRNAPAGFSTGPEPDGIYQEQMEIYADDAIAVLDFLQTQEIVAPDRIAIAGWSGGGFTAAFAAAKRPSLAGYVNIAGDASHGFEQASHLYISRLYREGYSDAEIAEARAFVHSHFGTASGTTEWSDYQMRLDQVEHTDWYQYLSSRFAIPYSNPDRVLGIGTRQSQWPPNRVYGKVRDVPTLGVFFEWDHSSAPSSPINFLLALREAGNGNVQISNVPDANHGGFLVGSDGYRFNTDRLTGRSPILIETVADWLENTVKSETD